MSDRRPRQFTGVPAVRASVPLWIGLYGPSGSGKTYSALRLARGIQSVCGGKIGVGDTENKRALHYASEFDFMHYPFDPPFDPLAYRDLIEQMAADGITVAIIDSASHEHEGQGGVLEMHAKECARLAKAWNKSEDAVQLSAWDEPKTQHRALLLGAQRTNMHMIWCYRAKRKLLVRPGKAPVDRGFMPIGAEDIVFEMAMRALLLPGANGIPTWRPAESGEKEIVRLPNWAQRALKEGKHPIDEDFGAALARWAKGDATAAPDEAVERDVHRELLALYDRLTTERQERLRKAIPSRDAILTLPAERARKGIEVMRRALQEQVEEERANSLREMDDQDPGYGDENSDAPEETP